MCMGRKPKGRQIILDAARHIVRERGAGSLTYEELVQQSGLTRGGITYHFPTKDVLLRELISCDIEQWREIEEQLKPELDSDAAAELIAYIRSHSDRDEDHRRFVTGMLSAATLDPSLLDMVREYNNERTAKLKWTEQQLMQQLLRLAAEGLFWSEIFACQELPATVRKRLVTKMEQLAEEWTEADAS
jgi:AcrR family transcriptional regulator